MNRLIYTTLLIGILSFASTSNLNAQCSVGTATCWGNYVVNDNNPGTYYLIYLRVVTERPTTSNWTYVATLYPIDLGTNQTFNGKTAYPVGFSDVYDTDFYTIIIKAEKYSGG